MKNKTLLSIGIESKTREYLLSIYPDFQLQDVANVQDFEKLFESNDTEQFLFVAVGPEATTFIDIKELAQGLRSLFLSKKLFYYSTSRTGFERQDFIKNGFDDAFLVNIDGKLIKNEILSLIDNSKSLKPVKLIDIEPDSTVDFNVMVFLPKNRKYIKYVAAGQIFEKVRLNRLIEKNMGTIFVPDSDLQKFYNYSAQRIRKLKGSSAISETEKQEKMQEAVRNVFSNLFEDKVVSDFEFGKETVNECKKMISTIVSPDGSDTWMDNLLRNIKNYDSDLYSHSTNVSIYSTLFALALNLPSPEDFAVAGLFHDLGKDVLSVETASKREQDMTPEELVEFKNHPQRSLDLLKEKKIIISDRIQKIILQHHENSKKTGFPNQPEINKFPQESQVFAIANRVENICQIKAGEKRIDLLEAIEILIQEGNYSLELLRDLKRAMTDKEQKKAA